MRITQFPLGNLLTGKLRNPRSYAYVTPPLLGSFSSSNIHPSMTQVSIADDNSHSNELASQVGLSREVLNLSIVTLNLFYEKFVFKPHLKGVHGYRITNTN